MKRLIVSGLFVLMFALSWVVGHKGGHERRLENQWPRNDDRGTSQDLPRAIANSPFTRVEIPRGVTPGDAVPIVIEVECPGLTGPSSSAAAKTPPSPSESRPSARRGARLRAGLSPTKQMT